MATTLYSNWDEGTTKTVVAHIASHPQPPAGAIQDGGMMSGIIQAFQSTGATVPTITDAWCDDACLDKYFNVTGAASTS